MSITIGMLWAFLFRFHNRINFVVDQTTNSLVRSITSLQTFFLFLWSLIGVLGYFSCLFIQQMLWDIEIETSAFMAGLSLSCHVLNQVIDGGFVWEKKSSLIETIFIVVVLGLEAFLHDRILF